MNPDDPRRAFPINVAESFGCALLSYHLIERPTGKLRRWLSPKVIQPSGEKRRSRVKLAYLVSHPIQYQAPLLRYISRDPDIDLKVFYWSDHSVRGYKDEGFGGIQVQWDVPLLEGYDYAFLPAIWKGPNRSFAVPLNRGIFRALSKGKFDVVWLHGFWSVNALTTMFISKLLGIPVILRAEGTLIDHARSGPRTAARNALLPLLRKLVRAVLTIGFRSEEYWRHYLGADFPAFHVPYAVDNAFFQRTTAQASPMREVLRGELDLLPGHQVILYASKLMPRKRCVDLVSAFLSMRSYSPETNPYLLIVGDGTEREEIEAMAQRSGSKNIRLLGFQNQSMLGRFFDLCDVFVLPSDDEPFGLVVNEAMNAGRPVIVSDRVGCQRDLVQDGVTGRVFPAGDVGALRKILEELIEDPNAFKEMGKRGLELINGWSFAQDLDGLKRALNFVLDQETCVEDPPTIAA